MISEEIKKSNGEIIGYRYYENMNLKISLDEYLHLNEISELIGVSPSSIVSSLIMHYLDELYEDEISMARDYEEYRNSSEYDYDMRVKNHLEQEEIREEVNRARKGGE